MKSPFQGLADLINSHPRYIALAAAIIVIAAFFGMSFVTMATGSDTYLDKNTKRGMLLDDYTATFQSDSILVLIETDGILTPSVLSYIEGLEKEIAKEQNVDSVSGIPDLLKSVNGGILPASSADIALAEKRIHPELLSRFVPSGTMTFAMATLKPGLTQDQQSQVVSSLNTRVSMSEKPPGVSVGTDG